MSASESFDFIMAGLNAGDQVAAAAIFDRFARRLIGLARFRLDARLRQKIDPEDVVQSVYRSFFVRQADGQFALGGWDNLWSLLTVLTVRKCRDVVDHFQADRRNLDRELAAPASPDESNVIGQALAREPTPSEVLMLTETVEDLLRDLPALDRETVSLALQGNSVAQISSQLDRPQRSVYRLLARIKKRLQPVAWKKS